MKKSTSLELKDIIKYGDKPLTTVGTPELICDGINEDNSGGNSEGLTFLIYRGCNTCPL